MRLNIKMGTNIIRDKSFDFALNVIRLYQQLQDRREFVLSKQLLRSGTSIGANVEEAIAAQSRRDRCQLSKPPIKPNDQHPTPKTQN
jgi:hypothetical protein